MVVPMSGKRCDRCTHWTRTSAMRGGCTQRPKGIGNPTTAAFRCAAFTLPSMPKPEKPRRITKRDLLAKLRDTRAELRETRAKLAAAEASLAVAMGLLSVLERERSAYKPAKRPVLLCHLCKKPIAAGMAWDDGYGTNYHKSCAPF